MLLQLAKGLMLLTLALMAWSVYQGQPVDALFQFLLGASLALLLRRWHETRQYQRQQAAQAQPLQDD